MLLWLVTFSSFLLSTLGKVAADLFLAPRGHVAILGSFAGLQYSENPGVAFGLTFPYQSVVILLAMVGVMVIAARSEGSMMESVGFGLIVGGAMENVADRLVDGLVTDFFQVGTFPIFNIADSCITIGIALLLWEALSRAKS